jgi:hypothetical protein
MMLVSQKRVAISLAFVLLCAPVTPTKAYDGNNASYTAGMACIIGAGIVGLCGLIYGIASYFKKSPEQIADDAEKVLHAAHAEGRRFYSEYMNVFMRARYGEPTLDDIEANFLEVIADRMYVQGINVEEYIYAVEHSIKSLEKALTEVQSARENSRSRSRTPLYDRLEKIGQNIAYELEYLRDYYQRFANHRAYLTLAVFEFKLRNAHPYEITLLQLYPVDSYQLATSLLQKAKAYSIYSDYPMVYYYELLRGYNETLNHYIRDLNHWYPRRSQSAQQLIDCFGAICSIIADTPAFREERELKKEDDARRRMIELREREVRAQAERAAAAERQARAAQEQARAAERQAYAAQQQAQAAQQQARAAQQQQTVVVVQQQVVQQAPAASQSTATNQNSSTAADAQTITVGQGNNKRQVSVEWYEQNKAGKPNDYTV